MAFPRGRPSRLVSCADATASKTSASGRPASTIFFSVLHGQQVAEIVGERSHVVLARAGNVRLEPQRILVHFVGEWLLETARLRESPLDQ